MRLIDKDEILNQIGAIMSKYPEDYDEKTYKMIRDEIRNEKREVEAIPIEWLHSIMEKQIIFAMESEMEGTTTVKDGVIHCVSGALACQVLANIIELWEKENGKEKS